MGNGARMHFMGSTTKKSKTISQIHLGSPFYLAKLKKTRPCVSPSSGDSATPLRIFLKLNDKASYDKKTQSSQEKEK